MNENQYPSPAIPNWSWKLAAEDGYCSGPCEGDIRTGEYVLVLNDEYFYETVCAKSIYGKIPPTQQKGQTKRPPPFV